MKALFISIPIYFATLILFSGLTLNLHAQTVPQSILIKPRKEKTFQYSDFMFWAGSWRVSWSETNGTTGGGTNTITPILDGKALEENFNVEYGAGIGFSGKSISYFDSETQLWKQFWIDNKGTNYEFVGNFDDNLPKFTTKSLQRKGEHMEFRMVFRDITPNSLTWDWEKSSNQGESWDLIWQINYTRVNPIEEEK